MNKLNYNVNYNALEDINIDDNKRISDQYNLLHSLISYNQNIKNNILLSKFDNELEEKLIFDLLRIGDMWKSIISVKGREKDIIKYMSGKYQVYNETNKTWEIPDELKLIAEEEVNDAIQNINLLAVQLENKILRLADSLALISRNKEDNFVIKNLVYRPEEEKEEEIKDKKKFKLFGKLLKKKEEVI